MSRQIETIVTIPLTGEIEVEVNGAAGQSCLEETENLGKLLGNVTSLKKKKEFYQREDTVNERTIVNNSRR